MSSIFSGAWWKDGNYKNPKVAGVILILLIVGELLRLASHGTFGGMQIPSQLSSYWGAISYWAITTLICFALLNVFYLAVSRLTTVVLDAAMMFSIFWGLAAGAAIFLTIFFLYTDPLRQTHAFLAAAGGAIVGWLLGMYFSPKDSSEQQEFGKIQAAVAAIASGYTLKGIQDFAFEKGNEHYQMYLVLAAITAALTTATIYNVRAYGNNTVRISFDKAYADATDSQKVIVKDGGIVLLKAAVTGPNDTAVTWSVLPDSKTAKIFGTIASGTYTADLKGETAPITCRVKAESIADPRLCDVVTINISA